MNQRGIFITFEGIDGCGKTTQLRLLGERLRSRGCTVVETAEPGGTEIGRQIRKIVLDARNTGLNARAELLLYFASRAQNVEQVIRPALQAGSMVLCDRFTDSTMAYQGCGRGLDAEPILQLAALACRGLAPELTILIDIDLETSRERSKQRNERVGSGETRIDDESAAFHARVRDGYHALAREHPGRIRSIDGNGGQGAVAKRVWEQVEPYVR
ncbi:MAG: dTMP kinase [Acidobacteriota bacterium]|nr:dTMP kinase [Acidobacteriota bacterium]